MKTFNNLLIWNLKHVLLKTCAIFHAEIMKWFLKFTVSLMRSYLTKKKLGITKMLSNADQVKLSHFTDKKRRLQALTKNVNISSLGAEVGLVLIWFVFHCIDEMTGILISLCPCLCVQYWKTKQNRGPSLNSSTGNKWRMEWLWNPGRRSSQVLASGRHSNRISPTRICMAWAKWQSP